MFLPSMPDWYDQAVCATTDPESFYPEKGRRDEATTARAVCASCPVREQCLAYALENDERWGIWGGVTERDRRKMKAGAA